VIDSAYLSFYGIGRSIVPSIRTYDRL